MKQKLFCLCVASLFVFAVANVTLAQTLAPTAEAPVADCSCAHSAPCKCGVTCNPCGYGFPYGGYGCAPCSPYVYPYYPGAYRVGLFGCVRPVVAYPNYYPGYYGCGYPYGYYPRYCW